jgi:hypothetical protein
LQLIKEIDNEKKIKDVVKAFGVKQPDHIVDRSTLFKNRDSLKQQSNENASKVWFSLALFETFCAFLLQNRHIVMVIKIPICDDFVTR